MHTNIFLRQRLLKSLFEAFSDNVDYTGKVRAAVMRHQLISTTSISIRNK